METYAFIFIARAACLAGAILLSASHKLTGSKLYDKISIAYIAGLTMAGLWGIA